MADDLVNDAKSARLSFDAAFLTTPNVRSYPDKSPSAVVLTIARKSGTPQLEEERKAAKDFVCSAHTALDGGLLLLDRRPFYAPYYAVVLCEGDGAPSCSPWCL